MNWKDAAGRKKGDEDYVFGDFTRSLVHGLSQIGKKPGSSNGRLQATGSDSDSDAPALPADTRTRLDKLEELEAFHKMIDGDPPVGQAAAATAKDRKASIKSSISIPPVKPISLEGASWPDPDPVLSATAGVRVDNVTGLSTAEVDRICYVRTIADIQKVLATARTAGRKVSMRGTKHAMGSHTIPAPGGFLIDTTKMREVRDINPQEMSVVVGPGAMWSDLIRELNAYGLSPRTMQSYSSFSVGGTISVNGHGITTDYATVESVLSLKLVKWDGTVVDCAPDAPGEGGELYRLAIGGYGMFGVIGEVKLKVVPNAGMSLEVMSKLNADDFLAIYQGIHEADDVEVKLGRIDIANFETFQLFVFRRCTMPEARCVSHLPFMPKEMSKFNQLMYKWVLPNGGNLRKFMEDMRGSAMDFDGAPTERNALMYESAVPLVKLYNPLFEMEDTFVLQEYFLAPAQFRAWVNRARDILTVTYKHVTLLNCTIRYVKCDEATMLAYSRSKPAGSFAFVLYYRLHKSAEGEAELSRIHNALVDVTLPLGGTFYLPYRHYYSHEQLKRAYPRIEAFFERKLHYDPHNIFESGWSAHYGAPYLTADKILPWAFPEGSETERAPGYWPAAQVVDGYQPRRVEEFRSDSYRKLMRNPQLKLQCFDGFLKYVLNIEDANDLHSVVCKATWDSGNRDDYDIYDTITRLLVGGARGPIGQLKKAWKLLSQLNDQRREFTRELASILSRLNHMGKIKDFLTCGDNGKMVLAFRETLGMTGTAYVANNKNTDPNPPELVMLERGSEAPVGQHVFIDYENPTFIELPDSSVDLVTLMGGLHHYPQHCLMGYLGEVRRVLRPGGLFVVREHDCTPQLLPMLDVAHSLFNAVTGETLRSEKSERRAFRPLLEWREIVEAAGLTDVMLYEMQAEDPTIDEMMVFVKDQLTDFAPHSAPAAAPAPVAVGAPVVVDETAVKTKPKSQVESLLDNLPKAVLEFGRTFLDQVIEGVENLQKLLLKTVDTRSPGQRFAGRHFIQSQFSPVLDLLRGIKPYADAAKLKSSESGGGFIPREVYILVRALFDKAERGTASANELLAVSVLMDIHEYFDEKDSSSTKGGPRTGNAGSNAPTTPLNKAALVPRNEVVKLFDDLLASQPALRDTSFVSQAGFSHRAQLMLESKLKGRQATGETIADSLIPFLDAETWQDMVSPLQEIIRGPQEHKFTLANVTTKSSPWWHFAMGFLGSPFVKPNNYVLTAASWIGFRPIVQMWQVAQQTRRSAARPSESALLAGDENDLTVQSKTMLKVAAQLAIDHPDNTSFDALVRCLYDVGFVDLKGDRDEITWYRLPEWNQVEMIRQFGTFLENEPWFRFPFVPVFSNYLNVLSEEVKVVLQRDGFAKAFLSMGFVINSVPALVMGAVFGQLYLLALPCRLALGNEYTDDQNENLVMHLAVLLSPNDSNGQIAAVDWKALHPQISSRPILGAAGLHMLRVPAMYPFTKAVRALAKVPNLRVLRISSHAEVQVRVSLSNDNLTDFVKHLPGVSIKFQFAMPMLPDPYDGRPEMPKKLNLALGVMVPQLMDAVRTFEATNGITIEQIYCFW